jgi:RNA polymerase sigma factor (TIGR02999 family)
MPGGSQELALASGSSSNLTSMAASSNEITQLLTAWGNGDQNALDQLMPLIYSELHRLAHRHIKKERPGHTLQTSALLNEAFLRLVDQRDVTWKSRAHFFAIAAQMMRRILVDYARSRGSAKRAGNARQVSFDEELIVSRQLSEDILELHDALNELAVIDERKSKVVELKFFGGLSIEETAEVLGVSPGTVMRDWTLSKAWLRLAMTKSV